MIDYLFSRQSRSSILEFTKYTKNNTFATPYVRNYTQHMYTKNYYNCIIKTIPRTGTIPLVDIFNPMLYYSTLLFSDFPKSYKTGIILPSLIWTSDCKCFKWQQISETVVLVYMCEIYCTAAVFLNFATSSQ